MLRAYVDVPDSFRAKARYAFETLAMRWRIPLRFVQERRNAHIEYSGTGNGPVPVHIPFDPLCYEATTPFAWEHAGPSPAWKPVRSTTVDPIGAVYRLLMCLDETQIDPKSRDRMRLFFTTALPEQRRSIAATPVIEQTADRVLTDCIRIWPQLENARRQIWPNGKKYALAITHDVDHVHASSIQEIGVNAAKTLLYRDVRFAHLCALGLRAMLRPDLDPYFMFPKWKDLEKAEGVRSAFYVFFRPKSHPAAPHDCKSYVNSRKDWEVLRTLADGGWEIGLHAPIRMKAPEAFRDAKLSIEEKLGTAIHGVRHHYLALDPEQPYETHRAHAESGFEYDSSIAWRDVPGFRAGTCLPFAAFHHVRNEPIPIIVLPFTVMDTHLLNVRHPCSTLELDRRVDGAIAVLRRVKECGGIAIVNWHQETGCGQSIYSHHVATLNRVLAPFLTDPEAWITTPRTICTQWSIATQQLLGSTATAAVQSSLR